MEILEISDIKEVFSPLDWQNRIKQNPRKLYGFLLFADEHKTYRSFIQEAWRTLDSLSGEACDIFTLERKYDPSSHLAIEGGKTGQSRRITQDDPMYPDLSVVYPVIAATGCAIVDNGLTLPERTQCFEVRDKLFKKPKNIILPGLAIFADIHTKKAIYFDCHELEKSELNESFKSY